MFWECRSHTDLTLGVSGLVFAVKTQDARLCDSAVPFNRRTRNTTIKNSAVDPNEPITKTLATPVACAIRPPIDGPKIFPKSPAALYTPDASPRRTRDSGTSCTKPTALATITIARRKPEQT